MSIEQIRSSPETCVDVVVLLSQKHPDLLIEMLGELSNNSMECEYKTDISGSNSEDEEECDDCEGKCQSNETETCENCAVKLRIGCANNPSDESIFNGLCDACREEEEEEEVRCVCPKCFAEGHTFVSKERAKELEEMEEMEEMCPFGEKCNGEEEMPTVEGTPGSVLPPNVVNTIRAWLEKKQAPLCFRINGGECKQCNSLCVDEEDSLCHKCYHKSNPVECYCDEEENRAWSKEKKIKI
jgi:hypothetical protein